MRAFAYDASAYNASICEHMRMRAFASHRMRTHFSCVMRAFAYVIWASSVSVMRAYARIRMRCERIRIACARIRIACARIACECAHLRGTYACPVLYFQTRSDVTRDVTFLSAADTSSCLFQLSRRLTQGLTSPITKVRVHHTLRYRPTDTTGHDITAVRYGSISGISPYSSLVLFCFCFVLFLCDVYCVSWITFRIDRLYVLRSYNS